jgi:hypothetical protein
MKDYKIIIALVILVILSLINIFSPETVFEGMTKNRKYLNRLGAVEKNFVLIVIKFFGYLLLGLVVIIVTVVL